jgi:hypothetical protein
VTTFTAMTKVMKVKFLGGRWTESQHAVCMQIVEMVYQ